jgi:hypothetical protein
MVPSSSLVIALAVASPPSQRCASREVTKTLLHLASALTGDVLFLAYTTLGVIASDQTTVRDRYLAATWALAEFTEARREISKR